MDPWVHSTGFRTNALRFCTLGHSNDPRVAEYFLVNTRLRRNDRESEQSVTNYFADASVVMLSLLGEELKTGLREVSLPEAVKLRMELEETINRRRSIRRFSGDTMELSYLAALVRAAAKITCQAHVTLSSGGHSTLRFRTTPSGGGLYPIDLYLVALNVKD